MTYIVGIDYGLHKQDIPWYTIAEKHEDDTYVILESGKIEELDLNKYPNMIIAGDSKDIEKFKAQFKLN